MKKLMRIILLMVFSLTACGVPNATEGAGEITQAVAENAGVVVFTDPVLESKIREQIDQLEGDISLAAAETILELDLSNETRENIPEDQTIKDLSDLAYFKNLFRLNLRSNEITDIRPLAELSGLRILDLSDNPLSNISPLSVLQLAELNLSGDSVVDLAPLAEMKQLSFLDLSGNEITEINLLTGMTRLKTLLISGCPVADISVVSEMKALHTLDISGSLVSDISPLEGLPLISLRLSGSAVTSFASLEDLYPNLTEKDFSMAFSLQELGFRMNDNNQANFATESASITINHAEWGAPQAEWDANIIWVSMYLEGDYRLDVGFYGDLNAYVFQMDKEGMTRMNYVYDATSNTFIAGSEDRASSEQAIRAAMDVVEGEDVLLAPIHIFDEIIQNAFNMTADALYALPFEPVTLRHLGFFPDEPNAVMLYEQREGREVNIEVHRPEWGEKEYDVRFYTPVNDYYLIVTYDIDQQSFHVATGKTEDQSSYACFDFYRDDSSIDTEVSEGITVEEYLKTMYADPGIEDVRLYSIQLMRQYISDTFDMTIDELYALPVGE